VTRSLAGALVCLHSRSWRDRYGDEFSALLQDLPANPGIVADALLSAARSRARQAFAAAIAVACSISLVPAPQHLAQTARAPVAECHYFSSFAASNPNAVHRCLS